MTKAKSSKQIGILHYSAPPVVGGVESVLVAHVQLLRRNGYNVVVIAGRGAQKALPPGTRFASIPLADTQHEAIVAASDRLEKGCLPANFADLTKSLKTALRPIVASLDALIVHNVFTKHFNLPLTAALFELLDEKEIANCIAWTHDMTWTSPNSRSKVFDGAPWDFLRTYRNDIISVAVSEARRDALAKLYGCAPSDIHVVYNGVAPEQLWGLTPTGKALVNRLGLISADLNLLMPVRITQAKNIELALAITADLVARGLDVKVVCTGPPDPHSTHSMTYYRNLQRKRSLLALDNHFHFVYEAGADDDTPQLIDMNTVADFYRVADMLLMPSHREGFGMPIVEAGLLGLPMAASMAVPAAQEITSDTIMRFSADSDPTPIADHIANIAQTDARIQLARQVRQQYTWNAIFKRDIQPLLSGTPS